MVEKSKKSLPFWKEYPDRDTEFVRVYPTTKSSINEETIFSKKETNLHIKIPYMFFNTESLEKYNILEDGLDKYFSSVIKEIDMYAKQPYIQDCIIYTIYIEGVNYNNTMIDKTLELINYVKSVFTLSKSVEISFDVLVGDINHDKLKKLHDAGFNRVNFITFSSDKIDSDTALHIHNYDEMLNFVNSLKDDGFISINAIVLAESSQPNEPIIDTLYYLAELGIDNISYLSNSSADTLAAMYADTKVKLRNKDYINVMRTDYDQYVGYRFSKPEKESVYHINTGKHDMETIGIGVSCNGHLNDYWYKNLADINDYYKKIDKNQYPLFEGAMISKQQKIKRYFMFGLLNGSIDRNHFYDTFGFDPLLSYSKQFFSLSDVGVLEVKKHEITMLKDSYLYLQRIYELFADDSKKQMSQEQCLTEKINTFNYYPEAEEQITEKKLWAKKPIGLYLHIPFCKNMCMSCPWHKIKPIKSKVECYLEALKKEITLYANKPYIKYHYIDFGYLGGGTPTTLSESQFEDLFAHIHKSFTFREDIEFTIETTPVDITESKLETLMKLGINRISLGVQAFDDDDLYYIGRNYTSNKVLNVIKMIKDKGIKKLNIDLMYGTPGQTMESWLNTINIALTTGVTGVSLYNYMLIDKPSNIFKKMHNEIPELPDEEMRTEMFYKAAEILTKNGYMGYFGDEFSLPGFKNAYVTKPWEECLEQMSLGCFVQGLIKNHWFFNETEIKKYEEYVENDIIPAHVGSLIRPNDELRRRMILGVKTGAINIEEYKKYTGVDFRDLYADIIADLEEKGLVILTDTDLEVVGSKGWYYLDNISKAFFEDKYKRYPQPCH